MLPSYIPGDMVTTSTHDSPLQVDHQPPVLPAQTLGSVGMVSEAFTCSTQNLGSVDRRRGSAVSTRTLASVGSDVKHRAISSTEECSMVVAQSRGDVRAMPPLSHYGQYDQQAGVSEDPHTAR